MVDRMRLLDIWRVDGASERREDVGGRCAIEGVRFVRGGGDMKESRNATVPPGLPFRAVLAAPPPMVEFAPVPGRSAFDLMLEFTEMRLCMRECAVIGAVALPLLMVEELSKMLMLRTLAGGENGSLT